MDQKIEFLINRLREVDEQLKLLNQEKAELREEIRDYLIASNLKKSHCQFSNETVYLTLSTRVNIRYD